LESAPDDSRVESVQADSLRPDAHSKAGDCPVDLLALLVQADPAAPRLQDVRW
jgi:hypothetical protein